MTVIATQPFELSSARIGMLYRLATSWQPTAQGGRALRKLESEGAP